MTGGEGAGRAGRRAGGLFSYAVASSAARAGGRATFDVPPPIFRSLFLSYTSTASDCRLAINMARFARTCLLVKQRGHQLDERRYRCIFACSVGSLATQTCEDGCCWCCLGCFRCSHCAVATYQCTATWSTSTAPGTRPHPTTTFVGALPPCAHTRNTSDTGTKYIRYRHQSHQRQHQ